LKISIIIPVYNESTNVSNVIDRVSKAPLSSGLTKEIIVVDDGSTDGTSEILNAVNNTLVKVHHSMLNFGKGTAIRVGLKYATGDIVIVQDGDTEYNPAEIDRVVAPIVQGKTKVVYGSRFLGTIDGMYLKYWLVNKLLVMAVLLLYGTRLTDEATGYKAFDRQTLDQIPLTCRRFEFCPEVTAKILRRGLTILEVPITYSARTVQQGKKIRFWDAVEAFWTLLRYRFW
jgi:glycosyltransferase involved in cell wall biosynthesis